MGAQREGVEVVIPHAAAVVYVGGKRSDAYVAIELDPLELLSEEIWARLKLSRCHECGAIHSALASSTDRENLLPRLKRRFVLDRVPGRQGLVLEEYDEDILATSAFMDVYKTYRMTGLVCEQAGLWV